METALMISFIGMAMTWVPFKNYVLTGLKYNRKNKVKAAMWLVVMTLAMVGCLALVAYLRIQGQVPYCLNA